MTESSLYAPARHVFYAESFLALAFSALFVVALRTAGSAASFRKHKAKGAFRLALLGVALGDFVQSSSVLAYVFDLRPNDPRRTTHSTPACALAGKPAAARITSARSAVSNATRASVGSGDSVVTKFGKSYAAPGG